MPGVQNLGITDFDFCVPETGLPPAKCRHLYEFPLESPNGDLGRKKTFLSGDIEAYGVINKELSDSASFITKKLETSTS